jgi:hypothetical protein
MIFIDKIGFKSIKNKNIKNKTSSLREWKRRERGGSLTLTSVLGEGIQMVTTITTRTAERPKARAACRRVRRPEATSKPFLASYSDEA